MRCWVAIATLGMTPATVWAHGAPLDRAVGWQDWNWDPVILLNLTVVLWLYCRGWQTLRHRRLRNAAGAGSTAAAIVSPQRTACFAVGMLVLFAALVSPLDPLGEQLGAAHMVQHMVLMTVAAPLLVASGLVVVCLGGLAPASRRVVLRTRRWVGQPLRRWLWNPLVAWTIHALVMWLWHLPALYVAALRGAWAHDLQHIMFFVAAWLFWRLLLDPTGRWKLRGGLAVLYLFTTTLHATVLGVLMTIAPTPWYPPYELTAPWWGLTALEDQQLAGLIMWMPACVTYVLVAIGMFAQALEDREQQPQRRLLSGVVTS